MGDNGDERPLATAFLTALQMVAMGLSLLVICNMAIDNQRPPVPECPLKAIE